MKAYDLAQTLYNMAFNHEDGTISAYDNPLPRAGYYVGGKFPSLVYKSVSEIDRGEIAWWVGSNKAAFYGVWVDSQTGKVYFDGVTHMQTEQYAVQLGHQRGEIAVWDIANGREIRVEL